MKDQHEKITGPKIEHNLYKTGDSDAPLSILDRNNEVVLNLCRRCGKGESELENSECQLQTSSMTWEDNREG